LTIPLVRLAPVFIRRLENISKLDNRVRDEMKIDRVRLVYFSPTGSTRRIIEEIAKGIGTPVEQVDLTRPEAKTRDFEEFGGELAIIGSPVYAGRIPLEAIRRLNRLKAHNTPAVTLVVYGNRAYEDALIELTDLISELGFKPIAGGAFVAQHSFSSPEVPIAEGRPDASDLRKAREFGAKIKEKLQVAKSIRDISPITVPGIRPYREEFRKSRAAKPGTEPAAPITKEELCTKCGKCVEACPNAAITIGSTIETQRQVCIRCYACIKNCPTGARVMIHPFFAREAKWLHDDFPDRKEPEIFA
jgi:ferredoxin